MKNKIKILYKKVRKNKGLKIFQKALVISLKKVIYGTNIPATSHRDIC